jgi:PAS domain S-box-containing protein
MRQALEALEKRWGLAVQSASFGVWDLNVPAGTVHYPPQWKALLGYDAPDVADTTATWRSRVHPDDLQPMLDALNGHLSGRNASYAAEFRLRAADGRYRWVLSRGRVVERDAAGQALRAIGTLTDLTERRELEQLRLERDRAEATSRAKTEFLARMSHELRTPLNAVLGFAQLLARRSAPSDNEQRSYAKHIEDAGWQLLTLVDTVLDLTEVQSRRVALAREPVALAPLIAAALQAAAGAAQGHRIELLPTTLPDTPAQVCVMADPARLRQVLDQLLDNAIRFNRPGGSVRIRVAPGSDAMVTLSVIDTGLGIPAAALPQLFEPLQRVGGATAGSAGVGVGLALAHTLVEAMGGRLAVHSSEGLGTTAEVSLPGSGDMR